VREHEERSVENIQCEEQEERDEENEQSLNELLGNIKQPNMQVTGILQGQRERIQFRRNILKITTVLSSLRKILIYKSKYLSNF
jgi:hypothetical protein